MDEKGPIESILAADIGSTLTHVCLIDLVEGTYRLVARAESPSTCAAPESDIAIGLRRAIKRLEGIAQRTLLDDAEELIQPETDAGSGVDAFVATSNAAPPLECVVIGLTNDLSLASAHHVCSSANALVRQTIALGDRTRRWRNRTLASLRTPLPDLIVMVGGIDTAPTELLEDAARVLVTVYEDIEPKQRPIIVYAGNQEARRSVSSIVSSHFDFRVVDNVRPSIHKESPGELQRELAEVYARTKLTALPGYRRLDGWCTTPILSTTEALSRTIRFVARRSESSQGVLGVDVGGMSTYIGAARDEVYQSAVGAALGTGHGIQHLFEPSTIKEVCRWLPIAMRSEEALNWLENARLRPYGIPQTQEDLLLMQAMARQALSLTMQRIQRQYWRRLAAVVGPEVTPPFDLILARGGLIAHAPDDGAVALMLLDALQPTGLSRLVVDWASIWPQLGSLAQIAPLAASQVLDRDSFRDLGTVIAPVGSARDGERALSLTILQNNDKLVEKDIPAGTIERFPLDPGESAILEVRPSRDFDIGLGRKGLGGKAKVRGGSLGIIVDTRGRPLALPATDKARRLKLQEWLESLCQ